MNSNNITESLIFLISSYDTIENTEIMVLFVIKHGTVSIDSRTEMNFLKLRKIERNLQISSSDNYFS